jgi:hypothetical protein
MFGLMLKNACSAQEADRDHYRLHYCGTCKAVGQQYSQSARMLLNFDCVFLAELLTALSSADTSSWQDNYHSYNCFATGGEGEELPFPLKFAATANVLLSALKTDDNLKDSPALFWRFMKRWFNADFEKAEQEMKTFGVDMEEIWHWIECQQHRESEKNVSYEGEAALSYYSEPTARITAAIFSRGAACIGHSTDYMYQFGYQLGELIYVIDALEDVDKDKKDGTFNALQRVYQTVDDHVRQSAGAYIYSIARQIQATIQAMPLSSIQKEEYDGRLSGNVISRVTKALEGKKARKANHKSLLSPLARRVQKAKSFAQQITQNSHSWDAKLQYAFSYMAVMIAPGLPQELNPASEHSIYSAPVYTTVAVGFLSAIFFRRKFRRFAFLYRKEVKRIKKNLKDKPKGKKAVLIVLLVLAGVFITVLILACICGACKSESEGCCDDCSKSCSDTCSCESCLGDCFSGCNG